MENFLKKIIPITWLHFFFRIYLFFDRRERQAVTAFIFNQNKILLVKHNYGDRHWMPPGGFSDKNETPEEALHREIFEEVGLPLENIRLLSSHKDKRPHKNITIHRFLAETTEEECIIDKTEIKEARWFYLNELQDLKISADLFLREAVDHYKKNAKD